MLELACFEVLSTKHLLVCLETMTGFSSPQVSLFGYFESTKINCASCFKKKETQNKNIGGTAPFILATSPPNQAVVSSLSSIILRFSENIIQNFSSLPRFRLVDLTASVFNSNEVYTEVSQVILANSAAVVVNGTNVIQFYRFHFL